MSWREHIKSTECNGRSEAIHCPEWDKKDSEGKVIEKCIFHVRTMTGGERDAYDAAGIAMRKEQGEDVPWWRHIRARLLVMCVVTPDGERAFEDHDYEWLSDKDGRAIQRLWNAASEWNKVTGADIEELKKTSEPTAAAASG